MPPPASSTIKPLLLSVSNACERQHPGRLRHTAPTCISYGSTSALMCFKQSSVLDMRTSFGQGNAADSRSSVRATSKRIRKYDSVSQQTGEVHTLSVSTKRVSRSGQVGADTEDAKQPT
jgi:hypothetical protein